MGEGREARESSSESDDEENTRLKEAAIEFKSFPPNSNKTNGENEVSKKIVTNRISKRWVSKKDANELKTTPEFRLFVAKKLSSYLDSTTKCLERNDRSCNIFSSPDHSDFRLFSGSCGNWVTENEIENELRKKRKKPRQSSSSNSSAEDEKLAEAAVTEEFIFANSRVILDNEINDVELDSLKKHKKCKYKSKHKVSVSSDEKEQLTESKKHKKKKKTCFTGD